MQTCLRELKLRYKDEVPLFQILASDVQPAVQKRFWPALCLIFCAGIFQQGSQELNGR